MIPNYFKKTTYDPKLCLCSLATYSSRPREEGSYLLVRSKTQSKEVAINQFRGDKVNKMKTKNDRKFSLKIKNKQNEAFQQVNPTDSHFYKPKRSQYVPISFNRSNAWMNSNNQIVTKPFSLNKKTVRQDRKYPLHSLSSRSKDITQQSQFEESTMVYTRILNENSRNQSQKAIKPKISISYLKKKILTSYIPYSQQIQQTHQFPNQNTTQRTQQAFNPMNLHSTQAKQNKEPNRLRSVKTFNLDDLCFKKTESIDGESVHVSVIESGRSISSGSMQNSWGNSLSQLLRKKEMGLPSQR